MTGTARLLLLWCLMIGVLGGAVSGRSYAYLTSNGGGTGNNFTAGTIYLEAAEPAGETLTVSNLVPGDRIFSRLNLGSTGTLNLRYAMTTSAGGNLNLASTLLLTIRAATGSPCSMEDGVLLFGPASASLAALGNPAVGHHPGDRYLAAGLTESLCLTLELPGNAPPALQGEGTTLTLNFEAEQE